MLKLLFPVSFRKLPTPILVIGIYFLLTPVVSLIATSISLGIPMTEFNRLLSTFSTRSLVLNFLGFLLGFGILGVKRWGYFLFLVFASSLIAHGIYLLILNGLKDEFLWNLLITVLPFLLIAYFLTQEVSTPYLTLIPRGFRSKWRIEIPINGKVQFEDKTLSLVTMDISPGGCLAKVEGNIPENQKVKISFDLDGQNWESEAEVVREVEGNLGFRFLISRLDTRRKQMDKFLSTKLLPRFTVTTTASIKQKNKNFDADVLNISERGIYISTQEDMNSEDNLEFVMKLMGISFKGEGKISWENKSGKFEKPEGYGIAFTRISGSLIYNFMLFMLNRINNFKVRER